MKLFQALTVAFTSQVIQKLTYFFENGKSIAGYIDYVHSAFDVSHFKKCEAPNYEIIVEDPFEDVRDDITTCQ